LSMLTFYINRASKGPAGAAKARWKAACARLRDGKNSGVDIFTAQSAAALQLAAGNLDL